MQHHCHNFYKMMEQDLPIDHHLTLMRLSVFSLSLAEQQVNGNLILVNGRYSVHFVIAGLPKGVMLSQSNLTSTICLTNNIASGCAREPFDPSSGTNLKFPHYILLDYILEGDDQYSFLSVIPMFHIFGLTMNVLQPLSAGAHVIVMPKFEPQHFISK